MNNGFTKKMLQGRTILKSSIAVVFQRDFVKMLEAQVELAKKKDSFRFHPETGSDPDSCTDHAMRLPYFMSTYNFVRLELMNSQEKEVIWNGGK